MGRKPRQGNEETGEAREEDGRTHSPYLDECRHLGRCHHLKYKCRNDAK